MNDNTINQSAETCLKYEKYTESGRQLIKRYFSGIDQHEGNVPVAHFEWTAEPEHDEQWVIEYARGNKCRFIVETEEGETEWGEPAYRITVRDYFNGNLVYTQNATRDTVNNLAQRCSVRFGFDCETPNDSEFLCRLKDMVLAEVNNE